jgi:hypothetical protein
LHDWRMRRCQADGEEANPIHHQDGKPAPRVPVILRRQPYFVRALTLRGRYVLRA